MCHDITWWYVMACRCRPAGQSVVQEQAAAVVARRLRRLSVQFDVQERVADQGCGERDAVLGLCRRETEAGILLELAPFLFAGDVFDEGEQAAAGVQGLIRVLGLDAW